MSKFAMIAVALMALVVVQGFPASDTDISAAAAKGDWTLVHKLIKQQFNDAPIWEPTNFSSGSVRSLKPPPGGHVYGKSEYQFRTFTNIDGKKNENSGGHKIINDDGVVQEYDYKP